MDSLPESLRSRLSPEELAALLKHRSPVEESKDEEEQV